jgi:hypothetical protein
MGLLTAITIFAAEPRQPFTASAALVFFFDGTEHAIFDNGKVLQSETRTISLRSPSPRHDRDFGSVGTFDIKSCNQAQISCGFLAWTPLKIAKKRRHTLSSFFLDKRW